MFLALHGNLTSGDVRLCARSLWGLMPPTRLLPESGDVVRTAPLSGNTSLPSVRGIPPQRPRALQRMLFYVNKKENSAILYEQMQKKRNISSGGGITQ